jgi:hypothetical protein
VFPGQRVDGQFCFNLVILLFGSLSFMFSAFNSSVISLYVHITNYFSLHVNYSKAGDIRHLCICIL